ncbi:MAG: hypothetical protein AAF456_01320 [Planctomycetota bacterium]
MIQKSTTITPIFLSLVITAALTVAAGPANGCPAVMPLPCCPVVTQQQDESSESSGVTDSAGTVSIMIPPEQGTQMPAAPDGQMDETVLREINQIRMRLGGGIAGHLQSLPHHQTDQLEDQASVELPDRGPITGDAPATPTPATTADRPASTSMERLQDPYGLREITDDAAGDPWEQMFEQQIRGLIAQEMNSGSELRTPRIRSAAMPSPSVNESPSVGGAMTRPLPETRYESLAYDADPVDVQRIRDIARDLDSTAADLEEMGRFDDADAVRDMAKRLREGVRPGNGSNAVYRR